LISNSKETSDFFTNLHIKSNVIYNIHEFNTISDNPFSIIQKNNSINFLWAGRFEKQKNPILALNAVCEVAKHFPEIQFSITFYGNGKLFDELNRKKRSQNLVKVNIYNWTTNIPFENFDILLITSLYEGFPNILLESIINNKPFIATPFKSGINEIIINDFNKIVADSFSTSDYSNKIIQFLALGTKERDTILSTLKLQLNIFSEISVTKQILLLYENIDNCTS
jgi:glycosyltransferase involved in cell wall biosynthesis